MSDEQREAREGWALNEQKMPTEVLGYACPDDYWWCPRIGVSIPASTFYATEEQARAAAVRALIAERAQIEQRLEDVRAGAVR